MRKQKPRFLILSGCVVMGLALTFTLMAQAAESRRLFTTSRHLATPGTTEAYLELSVEPVAVAAGEVFTLHISYHNIGLPYTTIHISPTGRVTFTPPLTMPCQYFAEPSGCTAVPLQALNAGSVQFTANATGEVYDETCGCWLWGGGSSRQPATLIISGTQTFLPFIQMISPAAISGQQSPSLTP